VGVSIGMNPKLARRAQPLVQMAASIRRRPCSGTAVAAAWTTRRSEHCRGRPDAAGRMYLLFNVIAGAQAIPSDLREAATVYQLRGWRRWRS